MASKVEAGRVEQITGKHILALREAMAWDVRSFAQLFGVHHATIYRWESRSDGLNIEPLQGEILLALYDLWWNWPKEGRATLSARLLSVAKACADDEQRSLPLIRAMLEERRV